MVVSVVVEVNSGLSRTDMTLKIYDRKLPIRKGVNMPPSLPLTRRNRG